MNRRPAGAVLLTLALALAAGALSLVAGPAAPATARLFVANSSANAVLGYPLTRLEAPGEPAPDLEIPAGPASLPWGLAVDSAGDLWVSNAGANTVVRYPAAGLSGPAPPAPATTIRGGALSSPWGLAFDASGGLWAVNTGNDTLARYTPAQLEAGGELAPAVTVRVVGCRPCRPTAAAFDRDGALWVTNEGGDGNLGRLVKYEAAQLAASGSPEPAVTLGGDALKGATAPAFDASGSLWVASYGRGAVLRFAPDRLTKSGDVTPDAVVTGGLERPVGLAFDGAGNLWVAGDDNSLVEYAADRLAGAGSLNLEPAAVRGQLNAPRRLAFDPPPSGLPLGR